jgi:hypothetical protein
VDLLVRPRGLPLAAAGRRSATLILVAWWIVLGASNFLWLRRDTRPPHWDAAVHLLSSLRYRRVIDDFMRGQVPAGEAAARLFSVDAYYPPVAPFMVALTPIPSRPGAPVSTWVLDQAFLALLMLGTFRLARRLRDSRTGIAAAVAVGSFGAVWSASHAFMLDLPLAAVVSLALDALLATDRFAETRRSLFFGALAGIGMLTKWTFLVFLLLPVIEEIACALKSRGPVARLRNAAAALLVAGLIALPWYLVHAPNLVQEFAGFGGFFRHDGKGLPGIWSPESLAFYPRSLGVLLLVPWSCALVAGIVLCWRRRPEVRQLATLSLAALFLLTMIPAKDARYALPLAPAAAIIATAWIDHPRLGRRAGKIAVGVLALGSLSLAWREDPPVRQSWRIDEALAAIPQSASGPPACVRVVPDLPRFHRFAFEYAAESTGSNLEIAGAGHFPWFTDAVILKTGDQGARPEAAEIMASIARDEGGFREVFRKIWEGPLPDGSRADVFVRDVKPVPGVAPAELVEMLRGAACREMERQIRGPFSGRIEVETFSDAETLRGRFRRLGISAGDLPVGGSAAGRAPLLLREMACDLLDLSVNPYRLRDGKLEILSLKTVAPRVRVREEDLNAWLAAQSGRVRARVRFEGGTIRALFRGKGFPSVDLALVPRIVGGINVGVDFDALRVGGFRVPVFPLAVAASQYNPVLKEMPCRFRIAALKCEKGIFEIEN